MHMADAWGRLTGEPGIAMVTGGPGHANAVGRVDDGAGTGIAAGAAVRAHRDHQLGRGGFQELRQAEMAAPVAKASWTATVDRDAGGGCGEGDPHRALGPAGSGASQPAVGPAGCERRRRTGGLAGACGFRRSAGGAERCGGRCGAWRSSRARSGRSCSPARALANRSGRAICWHASRRRLAGADLRSWKARAASTMRRWARSPRRSAAPT